MTYVIESTHLFLVAGHEYINAGMRHSHAGILNAMDA